MKSVILIIFSILLVSLFFVRIFLHPDKQKDTEKLDVSYEDSFLVDVRTSEEFEAGHVEGSVNIPLNEIEENFDTFKDKKQIIVFCRSGNRSGKAKNILEKNGFRNVINGGTWTDVKKALKK